MRDLRAALRDVQRACYCPPFAPNLLHGAMLFALAAEEARLEVGALVTGRPPEDFTTTARRYIDNPALIMPGFQVGGKLGAFWLMVKTLLRRAPDLDQWESERGYPLLSEPVLAHDSEEWLTTVRQKRLALLDLGDEPVPVPARLLA